MYIHTYIHTYSASTYIHTYIHTYIYTYIQSLLGDQDWGNNMIGVHFCHLGTKKKKKLFFLVLFVCWLCPIVIMEGGDLHNNDTLNPLYNHTLGDLFFFFFATLMNCDLNVDNHIPYKPLQDCDYKHTKKPYKIVFFYDKIKVPIV